MNSVNGEYGIKLYTHLLRNCTPEELEKEEIIKEVNEKLALLKKKLLEPNAKTVLNSLATILSFPTTFLLADKDLYHKSLKDYIGFGNHHHYLKIIYSLQLKNIRGYYDFYNPLLKEIINNYNSYNRKFIPSDIVDLLVKFSQLNIKNFPLYHYILADVAKSFNTSRNEDKIEIIRSLAFIGIKQTDLFEKMIEKVTKSPHLFYYSVSDLLDSLFKVGFENEDFKDNYFEFVEKFRITSFKTIQSFLLYLPILKLSFGQEKEFIEKYLPKYIEFKIIKNINIQFYEFLKYAHKDTPEFAQQIASVIPDLPSLIQASRVESSFVIKNKVLV